MYFKITIDFNDTGWDDEELRGFFEHTRIPYDVLLVDDEEGVYPRHVANSRLIAFGYSGFHGEDSKTGRDAFKQIVLDSFAFKKETWNTAVLAKREAEIRASLYLENLANKVKRTPR